MAQITFHPAQQAIYVASTGWVVRPYNDNGDPTKADVDASNLTSSEVDSWKNRLGFSQLALVDGSNLSSGNVASWQNTLAIDQKANVDASNLSAQDIAEWQTALGVTPGAGGDYVTISWNTVYGPEAYDRMVIVARRPSGWGSQTIFIGDTSDAVTTIIARTSMATDRNVGLFCSAKVPGGKYFKIATDGSSYGADYNFMVRM
ncbi:MAG: hypothetical protein LBF26_03175 [Puniceicoccales bacterium]|nr:hypothetical protein [Puniceicoccales bacterium]